MRVVALDLGQARVGVAISDELGSMAHPRPPIDGKDTKKLLAEVAELVREERVTRILVGYPLDLRGEEGTAAKRAVSIAQRVADATGVEVELVDERMTTTEAARRLREGGVDAKRGRGRIDGAAAAVLLQAWLDGQGR